MTMFLIQDRNLLINSDHIITADFNPEHIQPPYYDENNHMIGEKHEEHRLQLCIIDFESALVLRGDSAILLWEALCREAYSIGAIYHPTEVTNVQ